MTGKRMTPVEAAEILMPGLLGKIDPGMHCPDGKLHNFQLRHDGQGGKDCIHCRYFEDALGNQDFRKMAYL
jgi:hypothetical protein